jgi:predicted P-loop ATPase
MFRKLGRGWYDDSLTDVRTKDANDLIQGVWIEEMAELTATRYAESAAVKQFISKQFDTYRKAYGMYTETYQRQCIFVGTTNNPDFLADKTGNRRYWIVEVGHGKKRLSVWDDLTDDVVDQMWAEAKWIYEKGEELFLDARLEKMAEEVQKRHTDGEEMFSEIEDYLDTLRPSDWYSSGRTVQDRRNFF